MASQSGRPRLAPTLPRPTRGQIVWWIIGGVVALAAVASAALATGDEAGDATDGAGTGPDHPITAAPEPGTPLLLAA